MVTDEEYLMKKLPYIDLSQLKFKERDFLEGIFKFWRNREVIGVFEVSNYWDLRQRKLLGVRYDSRTNVYDWDYQMRLAQRDADIINTHEYKYWRNNGIAFEIREGDYDVPNKTLASGLILTHDGEKHARRGYWGDIIVSPYIALGIECEEKSFFKKSNKVFTKTASHVAEYNVMSMFHEISRKTKYKLLDGMEKPPEKPYVPDIIELDESDDQSDADSFRIEYVDIPEPKPIFEQEYEPLPLDGVKITFLPVGSLLDICKKSKYKKLFQVVYFSNSMVHLLQPDINPMFDDKATVIIESARYMIELKLEQVTMFVDKVQGIARTAGCTSVEDIDPEKTNFVKMLFERKESST
ncbi:Dynein assembly factor 3 [Mactra antiquata]